MTVKLLAWPLLMVMAVGFALRFIRHDLSPFILDEPQLLLAAHEGHWLAANPLAGTQALHYGPSYLWLATLLQKLAGPRVEVMLMAQSALSTAAHLCLAWSLSRAFRGGLLLFALIGAVLAVNPCLFFWSRTAWDNPLLNICVSFAVALLAGPLTWPRALLLGLVLALGANTHLMILPLIPLLLLVLLWEDREQWPKLLAGGAVALVVSSPYLLYLSRQPLPQGPPRRFDLTFALLLEPMRIFTAGRASYFFDADWWQFVRTVRFVPGEAVAISLALVTLAGLLLSLRGFKRLGILGLLFWPAYALFCASRGVDPHPHYQQPAIWLLPVGLAGLFAWDRRAAAALAALALIFTAVQAGFLVRWLRFIDSNGGTRGIHYSLPLAAQEAEVRRLCEAASPRVLVENHTAIFPVSLEYLMHLEPACADKLVEFCPGLCPGVPGVVRLEYEGSSARLR
jgi:hypothetical protein